MIFFILFFVGHITITQYLLNYYPGLDIEKRNVFGFTALMKSAMQGRSECIRALMLAGIEKSSASLSSFPWTTVKTTSKWRTAVLDIYSLGSPAYSNYRLDKEREREREIQNHCCLLLFSTTEFSTNGSH